VDDRFWQLNLEVKQRSSDMPENGLVLPCTAADGVSSQHGRLFSLFNIAIYVLLALRISHLDTCGKGVVVPGCFAQDRHGAQHCREHRDHDEHEWTVAGHVRVRRSYGRR